MSADWDNFNEKNRADLFEALMSAFKWFDKRAIDQRVRGTNSHINCVNLLFTQ